jgi:hypothetical protein
MIKTKVNLSKYQIKKIMMLMKSKQLLEFIYPMKKSLNQVNIKYF